MSAKQARSGPEDSLRTSRQGIICNNDGLFYWRTYASLCLEETDIAMKLCTTII